MADHCASFGGKRRACQYHYFKHTILQDNDGEFEEVTTTFLDADRSNESGRRVIGTKHIKEGTNGRNVQRWGRYTHHVMNAFETTVQNSQVVMPPNVRSLVQAIPEWLTVFVKVIDGEIIRQQIVECDFRIDAWQQVKQRDIPIFGCEPAVIIDQFVLSGWGPMEVEVEQHRLQSEKAAETRQRLSTRSRWQRRVWFAVLFATGVAASLSANILMSVLFMFAAVEIVRCHGCVVGHTSRLVHYSTGMLLAAIALAGVTFLRMGVEFRSPFDGLVGFACAFTSIVAFRRIHRLWPQYIHQ